MFGDDDREKGTKVMNKECPSCANVCGREYTCWIRGTAWTRCPRCLEVFNVAPSSDIGQFDTTLLAVAPSDPSNELTRAWTPSQKVRAADISNELTPIVTRTYLARLEEAAAAADGVLRRESTPTNVTTDDIFTVPQIRSRKRSSVGQAPLPAAVRKPGSSRGLYACPRATPAAVALTNTPRIAPAKLVTSSLPPPLPHAAFEHIGPGTPETTGRRAPIDRRGLRRRLLAVVTASALTLLVATSSYAAARFAYHSTVELHRSSKPVSVGE